MRLRKIKYCIIDSNDIVEKIVFWNFFNVVFLNNKWKWEGEIEWMIERGEIKFCGILVSWVLVVNLNVFISYLVFEFIV